MARRPRGVRFRYVAFRVEPVASRADVKAAVDAALRAVPGAVNPQLLEYRQGLGLVRCGHLQKDSVVSALNAIASVGAGDASIRTLGTSGTIRKARAKFLGISVESHPIKV